MNTVNHGSVTSRSLRWTVLTSVLLGSSSVAVGGSGGGHLQCRERARWMVDFSGTGHAQIVQWMRCGPDEPIWADSVTIDYPIDRLVVRAGFADSDSIVYEFTNADEPGLTGLVSAAPTDLDGDGTDELRYVVRVYGTGAMFEACTLVLAGGSYRCWDGPDWSSLAELLGLGETTYKGPIPASGFLQRTDPVESATPTADRTYWYWWPIYREGDPNCCPSTDAELWAEVGAQKGRLVISRVRRVPAGDGSPFEELIPPP